MYAQHYSKNSNFLLTNKMKRKARGIETIYLQWPEVVAQMIWSPFGCTAMLIISPSSISCAIWKQPINSTTRNHQYQQIKPTKSHYNYQWRRRKWRGNSVKWENLNFRFSRRRFIRLSQNHQIHIFWAFDPFPTIYNTQILQFH